VGTNHISGNLKPTLKLTGFIIFYSHDRATELLQSDVTTPDFRLPHVTFTPADVTQLARLDLVGKVTVGSD